jgi:hypothetical protein
VKLAIAVPALSNVPALFANDLAKLYAETRAVLPQVTLAMMVGTFVHQAREKLLHDMTELWGATHILWLDADMTFPPDTALRLLTHITDRDAGKFECDVVAANYVTRVPPSRPTARKDGQCVSSANDYGLSKVDHVGMGVFLMDASIVKDLPRPRFWYSTETETEDVYFCRLLRKAGHEIWIDHDLSKEVGHVGQHTYREANKSEAMTCIKKCGSLAEEGSNYCERCWNATVVTR